MAANNDDFSRDRVSSDVTIAMEEQIEKTSESHELFDTSLLVTWDGENDQKNPKNWTKGKKWIYVLVLSAHSLGVALGSSTIAPAIPKMAAHFGQSLVVVTLSLSLYVLGWATGPLVFSPLSEIYGRNIIFIPCAILCVIFQIGGALSQNIETLLITRLLAGIWSSPVNSLGPAFIYDIFDLHEAGPPIFWLAMCAFVGPALGPLAGGFLTQYCGWRWTLWFIAIYSGATLVIWPWFPETHELTLLNQKCRRLIKETGNTQLRTNFDRHGLKKSTILKTAIWRPLQLLVFEPIILLTALFVSIIWGILYLYLAAYPTIFSKGYQWKEGAAGAAFTGLGIGVILSVFAAGYANKLYVQITTKHAINNPTGTRIPEARLPLSMVAALGAPISIFWFAWTARNDIHWIVPILSTVLFGWCMVVLFICFVSYTTDCFPHISASAVAANTVLRSLTSLAFPLISPEIFEKLDVSWALSILGFVTLALTPIPFLFYKYGDKLRAKSRYTPQFVD